MIFKKRFQGDDVAITIYKGAAELNLPIALVPLWGEYPNVEGSLRLGIRDTTLLLLFKMRSPQLLRMVDRHNGPVYRDSCVEAFLKHAEREEYLNFEFSASGKILAAKGRSREQRTFFDPDLIDTIPRKIEILENTNRQSRYVLSVELDLKAFGLVEEGEEVKLGELHCMRRRTQGSLLSGGEPDRNREAGFSCPQLLCPPDYRRALNTSTPVSSASPRSLVRARWARC